jgi:two-component sensor histidine kinase
VDIVLNIEETEFDFLSAIPLGLMITEMLTNSFRHAFKEKETQSEINIQFLVKSDQTMELIFKDNGVGFTEGIERKKTDSIGLSVIFSLCSQLKGKEIAFFTEPGKGVKYHFSFPNKNF